MAVILKNRKFNFKNDLHKKNMPYSKELYEFIIKSRKCHTLYANCEGLYTRRVVNVNDKETLKNFIYYTLYFDGSSDWENDQDFIKRQHVEDILDKMISTSEYFNFEEEIHFGVVWVYYFLYENKTQKSMPVFKIYKEKSGEEAVILDVSLTLYPTWDYYLDYAKFPLSLLCVPRKGEYCFVGENEDKILDLEYVCSKRLTSNNGNFPNANYVPFSQNAVRLWLMEIKSLAAEKLEQIKQITYILWNKMEKNAKNTLFNVAVFAYSLWKKLVEVKATFPEIWDSLLRECLMLLNRHLEDGFWKNLLIPNFFHCITSGKVTSICVNMPGIYHEAIHLIELLRCDLKNWQEIFKSFCIIFRKGENLLVALSSMYTLPPILNYLLLFFKFSSKLEIFLKSYNNSKEIMKSEELECSTSLKSVNIISNFHSNQNQSYSLETVKSSDRISKSVVEKAIDSMIVEKAIDEMAVGKAVSNLSVMETTSAGEVQNQLFEESAQLFVKLQKYPSEIPPLLSTLSLKKENDHGIFLIQNTSLPFLTYYVSLLIGKKFVFKPEELFVYHVIDKSGNTLGTLFFPQEQCAFALFSLEEIRRKRKGRLLEITELLPKNT